MSKLKSILFYYNFAFIFSLLAIGVLTKNIFSHPGLLIIIIPLVIYFWGYLLINSQKFITPKSYIFWIFVSLLLIFNFFSTFLLLFTNLFFSKSIFDILISIFYLPLPIYFFLTIYHWYQKIQQNNRAQTKVVKSETVSVASPLNVDLDRRRFLKILGGTGVSVFLLSLLNPKQAGAAFFGSVPGPGTVSLKDANGAKINPAEKHPTDGYKISKIDDITSSVYAYYGFVNSDGAWYIQRETLSGAAAGDFQYYKGSTNFSSNWSSRSGFSYDDFEDIF